MVVVFADVFVPRVQSGYKLFEKSFTGPENSELPWHAGQKRGFKISTGRRSSNIPSMPLQYIW